MKFKGILIGVILIAGLIFVDQLFSTGEPHERAASHAEEQWEIKQKDIDISDAYDRGYEDGYEQGYRDGYNDVYDKLGIY